MSVETEVVVLVTAEELAAGRVVLAQKTVREVWWNGWIPCRTEAVWQMNNIVAPNGQPCRQERTVPQTLSKSECPDCGGRGFLPAAWKRALRTAPCLTCGGLGTVSQTLPESQCRRCSGTGRIHVEMHDMEGDPCHVCGGRGSLVVIHLAIEQWRHQGGVDGWTDGYHADGSRLCTRTVERRQAIVGYVTNPTVLPVLSAQEAASRPRQGRELVWYENGTVLIEEVAMGVRHTRTNEPWAQGLVPGSVVLEWGTVTPIDPPIVSLTSPDACDECSTERFCCDGRKCDSCRVPLSLEHGQLTEVKP